MKSILAFIILLASTLCAQQPKEKDITPKIVNCTWKWDHPTAKGRKMTLSKDGKCETTHWKGVWKISSGRTIAITHEGDATKKTIVTFSEDFRSFTGVHHDGFEITGTRQGDVPTTVR